MASRDASGGGAPPPVLRSHDVGGDDDWDDDADSSDADGSGEVRAPQALQRMRRIPGFIEAQQVLPGLWIGPKVSSRSPTAMRRAGIRRVLAMNGEAPMMARLFDAVRVVDVEDDTRENILQHLPSCVEFIQHSLEHKQPVLVYCTAGISRSATAVLAYLMAAHAMRLNQAYHVVKMARPFIKPNPGFVAQLQVYDKELQGARDAAAAAAAATAVPGPPDTPTPTEASECELCQLHRTTTWYHEAEAFVVLECGTCDLPMVVWRRHGMDAPPATQRAMEERLAMVADAEFGHGQWWLDVRQRSIPGHLHWHARPLPTARL